MIMRLLGFIWKYRKIAAMGLVALSLSGLLLLYKIKAAQVEDLKVQLSIQSEAAKRDHERYTAIIEQYELKKVADDERREFEIIAREEIKTKSAEGDAPMSGVLLDTYGRLSQRLHSRTETPSE